MAFLPPFSASDGIAARITTPSNPPVANGGGNGSGNGNARQNGENGASFAQNQAVAAAAALPSNGSPNGAATPPQKSHKPSVPSSYFTQFAADPASSRPTPQPQPFSTTTQEILNRIGSTQDVDTESPQWEAARKQVLQSMAGANGGGSDMSGAGLQTPPKRGRGRGRPPLRKNLIAGTLRADSAATPSSDGSAPTPVRGGQRGRPRGRGRGGRRGAKRKRDDDEDDDSSSSLSSAHSSDDDDDRARHEPTVTKSGRSVNKPAAFMPAPKHDSPSTTPSRRGGGARRFGRRALEMALCAKCQRGHSPASNAVVFCDACNTPWHQWCHDPPVDRAAIDIPDREWLCGACEAEREDRRLPMARRVPAGGLSPDQRAAYLATLPHPTLQKLLLAAAERHPELPLFAPNAAELLRARAAPLPRAPVDAERYPDFAAAALSGDPPSTYPRPGAGPHAPRPTTGPDDVAWLLDDDNGFGAFSHYYVPEGGADGAALVTVQAGGDGREGSWIRRGGGQGAAAA